MSIRKLTIMALLVAIAIAGSTFVSIPTGIARAYPVQHAINVISAIILGPVPTIIIAFVTAMVRILTGTGSLLAIPGSVIGALCAALAYKYSHKMWLAGVGEIIGTGILASLIAVPYAQLLMGTSVAALFFMPAFLTSSTIGAILGIVVASSLQKTVLIKHFKSSLYE
ncbi:energy coupling factor transporter S component ThiW [Lysinibacillus sp. FSL H8-0500]|uniref:energy coupling factor transporter S component ThiW n=1 Tax=Lysinibacillus sp. FSL H8-0500 TaxID=2921393 RepID=UPI003100D67C